MCIELYVYPSMRKRMLKGRLSVKKVYIHRQSPSRQKQSSAGAISGAARPRSLVSLTSTNETIFY
jgi:hypothetical protein